MAGKAIKDTSGKRGPWLGCSYGNRDQPRRQKFPRKSRANAEDRRGGGAKRELE